MQPILLLPFAFAGFRAALSGVVKKKTDDAAEMASSETVRRTSRLLMGAIFEMALNIVIFLAIVAGAQQWFAHQTAVMMICTVYAGSMLHAGAKLSLHSRHVYCIVNRHHLNLKRYLYEEIYRHAHCRAQQQIDAMGGLRRLVYKIGWGPDAHTIARRIADTTSQQIWHGILIRAGVGVLICLAYVAIFRWIVAPFIILQATTFTPLQAFLWPFAYAVDYFAGTSFSAVVAAGDLPTG